MLGLGAATVGCDQGTPRDASRGVGAPVRVLGTNVAPDGSLPANSPVEIAFDRLLAPLSVTRQSFRLEEVGNPGGLTPAVAYDPVTRVVTLTPLPDAPFQPKHNYELTIASPTGDTDANGLRTFDGATLDPNSDSQFAFVATDPVPSVPAPPTIDFCRDIKPITSGNCSGVACHTSATNPPPPSGLLLDPPSGITDTAIGRVAQGSNSGPRSVPQSLDRLFGEDMAIIDETGNPGQSFLLYKCLLAVARPALVTSDAGVTDAGTSEKLDATVDASNEVDASNDTGGDAGLRDDGGVSDAGAGDAGKPVVTPKPQPIDVSGAYGVAWQPMTSSERAALSNYIQGREMPYFPVTPLRVDQLQRLSFWIAQGSPVPPSCP